MTVWDPWDVRTLKHWNRVRVGGRLVVQHSLPDFPTASGVLEYLALSFCVHAYHLIDYVDMFDSGHAPNIRNALLVDGTALSVCRDVATNTKHAKMRSNPMSTGGANAAARGANLTILIHDGNDTGESKPTEYAAYCQFLVGQRWIEATELVAEAIDEWRSVGLPDVDVPPGGQVLAPHWDSLPELPVASHGSHKTPPGST